MATAANSLTDTIMGGLKAATLIGSALIAAVLVAGSTNFSLPFAGSNKQVAGTGETIVTIPLSQIRFNDLGIIPTPHLNAKIVIEGKSQPLRFLIDTGAKLSVAPMNVAQEMNVNTDSLKRIVLQAATADTAYGYLTDVDIDIEGSRIRVPLAFAPITEPLLGMHGFMDRYSVDINAKNQTITIKK